MFQTGHMTKQQKMATENRCAVRKGLRCTGHEPRQWWPLKQFKIQMQNEQAGKKLAAHGKWLLVRGGHNSRCDCIVILYMYLHCLLCVGPPILFCSLIIINDGMKRNARVLKISIIGFENQMIFSNLNNSKEFELLTLYRTFHIFPEFYDFSSLQKWI